MLPANARHSAPDPAGDRAAALIATVTSRLTDRYEADERTTIVNAATSTLAAVMTGLASTDPDERRDAEQALAALALTSAVRDADQDQRRPWDFDAVPYAHAVLESEATDTVFDTRAIDALAEGTGPITFTYSWEKTWTFEYGPGELDESAPGWRHALAHPDAPGSAHYTALTSMLDEDLNQHNNDEESQRLWCRVTTEESDASGDAEGGR